MENYDYLFKIIIIGDSSNKNTYKIRCWQIIFNDKVYN